MYCDFSDNLQERFGGFVAGVSWQGMPESQRPKLIKYRWWGKEPLEHTGDSRLL